MFRWSLVHSENWFYPKILVENHLKFVDVHRKALENQSSKKISVISYKSKDMKSNNLLWIAWWISFPGIKSVCQISQFMVSRNTVITIIIYLYKIAIFHHLMQSFRINRLLHAWCLLHDCWRHSQICDVMHILAATSISLHDHANERYADLFDV